LRECPEIEVRIVGLSGLPLVKPDDDIAALILDALGKQNAAIQDGDVVVIAQKIISKAEGRIRRLGDVRPGWEAERLARVAGKPPPLVQLILDESTAIVRAVWNVFVTRHRTGHVLANAGIDASNVEGGENDTVLLWPIDPDASAKRLHVALGTATGRRLAVIIADSLGRAWRLGTLGTAIGASGLRVTDDRRGQIDLFGRPLQATVVAVADAISAIAVLMMGEGSEGTPVVIVRGILDDLVHGEITGEAHAIVRPAAEDLFL
jgi:coenzyme F420-0:L-glutamate ligase / coenzyme F420-1:gamma-L-glutamate ligase